MAKALLNFHLHIEPTTSQYPISPEKTKASRKPQNHEPRIKHHNSSSSTTFIYKRKIQKFKDSISSVKRLLSYVNSGSLEPALQLFETMTKPNTFVWNVLIRGLVDSGMFEEAIEFYYRMQIEGIKADNFTFPFIIKACSGVFRLKEGQNVHSTIIKLGFDVDIYICNALIMMYAKGGCIEDAEKIFGCMSVRDLVSWNSMISGYVSSGDGLSSLIFLQKMQKSGLKPDRFSYISALGACALERYLLTGKEIFCQVLRNRLELDSMIQSSVIDMFGKCGEVDYAENFFNGMAKKNIVVWNAMIGAYTLNDKSLESFAYLLQGKAIHGHAIRKGYLRHLVLETALVDMYGKCRSLKLAECVFFRMKEKNLVSWNAMISAYVQNLKNIKAIVTFRNLQSGPCVPDEMTFTSVLAAYAEIALPNEGKQIHCHITKSGYSLGTFVSNVLIHMYAKCGDLESARKVFNRMLFKDVVSWNTIIMGYAIHGLGSYCLNLFGDMINEGYKPNESTFVSILSACSISGFVDQGWKYFDLMKSDYGLDPGIEHYGCMLDLLGREGNLDGAKSFIEKMPLKPTARIWGSLLVASRHHKNIEIAEMAATKIFSLDNDNNYNNIGCYVLLSNMYAEFGRWDDVERVRSLMKKRGLVKTTGFSMVECNGKAYKFSNYDKLQKESNVIYNVLDILSRKIGEDGYSCGVTKFRPSDFMKTRFSSPMCHSVRLAICFGLIGTSVGEPVVIRKNVRICEDCHSAAKRVSRVTEREIVVGDSKMYHRFKDGQCSCGDYW
ncbi:pentatricopeptide repeat-containing protein at4g35130 chloroplastic [Phtheirospermum japonicum]|uniref:Pentatricopeptide repeat-containing protein at4g35130 chloroplastic n=1 Tax=Phtheirospermum japonicum TaxID=374723 RepID=A0A830BZ27_9LAMI|nr:pentatricopeptide repeat-containing protein at4g35130 chloroplastic [Phtheirospermum japonicum]